MVGVTERLGERFEHWAADRVEAVGPVQRDGRDVGIEFEEQVGVFGHRSTSWAVVYSRRFAIVRLRRRRNASIASLWGLRVT